MAMPMRVLGWVLVVPLLASCQRDGAADHAGKPPLQAVYVDDLAPVKFVCESGKSVTVRREDGRAVQLGYEGDDVRLIAQAVPRGSRFANDTMQWSVTEAANQETGVLSIDGQVVETCHRAAQSAAPDPGLAPCRVEQMAWKAGEIDAALGHRQQVFEVSLKGRSACLLPAWPVVHVTGQDSDAVPMVRQTTDTYFGTANPEGRVTLKPDEPVTFLVGWSVIPNEAQGQTVCPVVDRLSLAVPAGGALAPWAMDAEVCGSGLLVSPFIEPDKKVLKSTR